MAEANDGESLQDSELHVCRSENKIVLRGHSVRTRRTALRRSRACGTLNAIQHSIGKRLSDHVWKRVHQAISTISSKTLVSSVIFVRNASCDRGRLFGKVS